MTGKICHGGRSPVNVGSIPLVSGNVAVSSIAKKFPIVRPVHSELFASSTSSLNSHLPAPPLVQTPNGR